MNKTLKSTAPITVVPSLGHAGFLLAFLNVDARISNAAKKYLDDNSERSQNESASARNYRCSISPRSIQGIVIYIFSKEGKV